MAEIVQEGFDLMKQYVESENARFEIVRDLIKIERNELSSLQSKLVDISGSLESARCDLRKDNSDISAKKRIKLFRCNLDFLYDTIDRKKKCIEQLNQIKANKETEMMKVTSDYMLMKQEYSKV